ncbi:hybrid sensor histidine kinase/response regulator [Aphanothece hegewaldii CCALA 016]|uniref:histidine kinase n=1 Tax=Aphanothece hegewaldii CCALA 016 TaxID=2107694 RepID=A0A2T1LVM5_9CHRO|nr:response regulator [Aphanothece hegewaldii]PSF35694.1 hybrid sensor histidine kinase/response regulator [Aphanothece hegewaldii CCALA 016]
MNETNLTKGNILIVDDTPDNLRLLSTMLVEQGYEVRSVINGAMAIMGAKAEPPDLILLDINMPKMNGYEVCQHLKADNQTQEIPIIFISALEDVFDKLQAFSVGGVDYITKPFQVEEVLARIETHLTICRLQKQLKEQNKQLKNEIDQRTKAEEKFACIFRTSPNPIAIVGLEKGEILEANPSFLKLSGFTEQEVIGHTANEIWIGKDKEAIATAIQQLPQTGIIYNREFELRTKTGELKIVLFSLELIELSGQLCALLIANDITERKRLENEFISLVSHELRTPLTSLMGSLDLLESGQLGQLSNSGIKVLNIAINNTERLIRLINNILDLERMKSGKITIDKHYCNSADLMQQATETLQVMADQSQIQIITQPVDIEIVADSDRLLQTFTNLLNNAIKFSEPMTQILFSTEIINKQILFVIKDQGRGIPADKTEIIFERFQQVDASDSRTKGGTGLGLAICRQIIEQHNGKIWVESTLGKGSSFFILLPL